MTSLRMVGIVCVVASLAAFPVATAWSKMPAVEPVRVPAQIDVASRNNVVGQDDAVLSALVPFFPGARPEDFTYLAGDLVVPRSTTMELAAFARAAGTTKAIRWFCDAYAGGDASLNGVMQSLVSEAGAQGELAADALACPVPGGRRRRPQPEPCPDTIAGAGCEMARALIRLARSVSWIQRFVDFAVGVEGQTLATAACRATPDMRASFDATACSQLLESSWRRRLAFKKTLRDAERGSFCLRFRAGAHPDIVPSSTRDASTLVGFSSRLTMSTVPCE